MHKSCIRTLPIVAAAVFGFAFTNAAIAAETTNRADSGITNGGYGLRPVTEVRDPDPRDHRRTPREVIEPEEFDELDERDHRRDRGHYGRQVCCQRGRREWWSSPRECRRSGGAIVSQRFCHRGYRVCCKWRRHGEATWTNRRRCARSGGRAVPPRFCRHHRYDDHEVRDHRVPHL